MPRISQFMIRTALIHLALGVTLGGLALADKGLALAPWMATLRLSHIPVLLVGCMVQLALGVAVWMMPRLDALGNRGNLRFVWAGYLALNCGVLCGAVLPWNPAWVPGLALCAAVCGLVAALTIGWHLWRRVLPFRTLERPGTRQASTHQ